MTEVPAAKLEGLVVNRRSLLKAGAASGALVGVNVFAPTTVANAAGVLDADERSSGHPRKGPVVRTSHGKIQGLRIRKTNVFRGVPYGRSTAGEARFLPPEPAESWDGIRDATEFGKNSPQAGAGLYWDPVIGEYFAGGRAQELIDADLSDGEDCLVLNVLTPAHHHGRHPLPVMVYFHGGGYDSLSGSITALADQFVARENVVLVTVNHRLGALGFMYLGDLSAKYAAGNVSLLDLVLALKWVKKNARVFGGDADNVTIFGDSGGGGKVQAVMGMPQARGLFDKAIIESSVALNWQSRADATQATRNLLTKLKIADGDVAALLKTPARAIVAAVAGEPASRFGPVVDGTTVKEATWVDSAPAQAARVPVIVGSTAQELRQFSIGNDAVFNLTWDQLQTQLQGQLRSTPEKVANVISVFRAAEPNDNASDVYFRVTATTSFGSWARKIAALKEAQPAPVYRYYFDYDNPVADGRLKASHTTELPLATGLVDLPEAQGLSNQLQSTWAAFARKGNPNNRELPRWPEYVTSGPATTRESTMVLSLASHSENNFFAAQLAVLAAL